MRVKTKVFFIRRDVAAGVVVADKGHDALGKAHGDVHGHLVDLLGDAHGRYGIRRHKPEVKLLSTVMPVTFSRFWIAAGMPTMQTPPRTMVLAQS